MATKIRFAVEWEGGGSAALCLKAFLDIDPNVPHGGATTITECDFYDQLAPHLDVRVPARVATVVDRERAQGVLIMRDLIAEGAFFCSALDPFTAQDAAASLDQIARLHAGRLLIDGAPWIGTRLQGFASREMMPLAALQDLLDGPRGDELDAHTRNAGNLVAGLRALAQRDAALPQVLVHGDCHAGNIFRTAQGPGLIDWQLLQRGGWALDIAYHICAVLPVETAAAEEWALLDHYLAEAARLGVPVPAREEAREQYRAAVVWGYYLWAITRRVDPPIINMFVDRLGKAVMRHDSFALLGV